MMTKTMDWAYDREVMMARRPGRTSGIALLPKMFHFLRNYVLLSKLQKALFIKDGEVMGLFTVAKPLLILSSFSPTSNRKACRSP